MVSISYTDGVPAAPAGPAEQKARFHALDTAKGIGIILVVFGHAWRGAFDAGILKDSALFHTIDRAIYAWHMPLFFFLSGLVFLGAAQSRRAAPFLASRLRRLIWPFALWTWLFFGVKLLAGGSANYPVTLADFPVVPLPPYEHLWFLWALFLSHIVGFGLVALLEKTGSEGWAQQAFAVLGVLLTVLVPFFYVPSPTFGSAIQHFPYFIFGVALGGMVGTRPSLALSVLAAGIFTLTLVIAPSGGLSLLASLVLTVMAYIVIAGIDPDTREAPAPVQLLRWLGLYSLPIFLAHTIFSAALRIGLLSYGFDNVVLHLVGATAIGLLGPILLVMITRRLRIAKLLGF